MKLHNTLSKKIEDFEPLKKGQATIYSCGPTVYDHIHIGNLRAFVTADILRRSLQSAGLTTKHVMNFTDVDDKTIRRSQETDPNSSPEAALKNLTREYEQIFLNDMHAIGNDVDAVEFVRATDSISAMQELISKLHQEGFAYIADDGVYFSIQKYRAAGKKYGQLLELKAANTSEARINNDEYDKESVHDFALWKTQRGNEPAWPFELDGHNLTGRPGWHIECSAMSVTALGQPFDIHTGGVDLIFPHHENEIAQSTATNDQPYANYFVHNEHLLVEGRKMAKSANNFFTLRDIREKGYEPIVFRILVLQAHYRSALNFSWANLEAAQNRLQAFYAMAALRWQTGGDQDNKQSIETAAAALLEQAHNDLDTPQMLATISQLAKTLESSRLSPNDQPAFVALLEQIDDLLGFDLAEQTDITDEQKDLLERREHARSKQNWEATDALRNELAKSGLGVRDTAHGQIWYFN
ncbi:MAG: cysteinyl-tRNA synthetase [Patescibacteria group bacterium]|nr:cysteinyl-tRNA synthetase [Patescibacteria group bacterium]